MQPSSHDGWGCSTLSNSTFRGWRTSGVSKWIQIWTLKLSTLRWCHPACHWWAYRTGQYLRPRQGRVPVHGPFSKTKRAMQRGANGAGICQPSFRGSRKMATGRWSVGTRWIEDAGAVRRRMCVTRHETRRSAMMLDCICTHRTRNSPHAIGR